jgi:hypothetical protein
VETNDIKPTISRTIFRIEERLAENNEVQFRITCSDGRFSSPVFFSRKELENWHFGPLGITERNRLLNLMNETEPPTEIIERPSPDTDLDEPLPERECSVDGDVCESCQ